MLMLQPQQTIPLSEYSALYDRIIPKDNILRQIRELVDFSFIYKELSSKYSLKMGRQAVDPIQMFKYLLLKTIYDISDVDVVDRSRYDMSFKYFMDMSPEADVIDPSSLCKFRRQRLRDSSLLHLLISKTVGLAIEKKIITTGTIIVDATHTCSRSNAQSPVDALKLRSHQLRKVIYGIDGTQKGKLPYKNEDRDLDHELAYAQSLVSSVSGNSVISSYPKIAERLNMLKETLDDIFDHYTPSKDSDARVGHKTEETSFLGYKSHLAMTPERIITAAVVTSGEKGDGPQLPELVHQTEENGVPVDTILGDTAYSGRKNLQMANDRGIELISKLHPAISMGLRKEEDRFDYNKDAGMFVCPAGHMAVCRHFKRSVKPDENDRYIYTFDVEKCRHCSRQAGCYKEGAKTKTYTVSILPDEQKEQMLFQNTDEFRQKVRERYKIEAKNSELKNVYGYGRAKSYGLENMEMQGALAIFTANIKRILKLS
jgi:transposase